MTMTMMAMTATTTMMATEKESKINSIFLARFFQRLCGLPLPLCYMVDDLSNKNNSLQYEKSNLMLFPSRSFLLRRCSSTSMMFSRAQLIYFHSPKSDFYEVWSKFQFQLLCSCSNFCPVHQDQLSHHLILSEEHCMGALLPSVVERGRMKKGEGWATLVH